MLAAVLTWISKLDQAGLFHESREVSLALRSLGIGTNEARSDLPTLPVEAPPIQVELNVPVGQVALAALTHPSQRPLLTLMVAPEVAASSLNSAVPDEPVVEAGLPPQNLYAVSVGLLCTSGSLKMCKARRNIELT